MPQITGDVRVQPDNVTEPVKHSGHKWSMFHIMYNTNKKFPPISEKMISLGNRYKDRLAHVASEIFPNIDLYIIVGKWIGKSKEPVDVLEFNWDDEEEFDKYDYQVGVEIGPETGAVHFHALVKIGHFHEQLRLDYSALKSAIDGEMGIVGNMFCHVVYGRQDATIEDYIFKNVITREDRMLAIVEEN